MVMFFYAFFRILCVQCPHTKNRVWIAVLCVAAEKDGYGEVCPKGQMPWPFFVYLSGDGTLWERCREWVQYAAARSTEEEIRCCGRDAGNGTVCRGMVDRRGNRVLRKG